ncbi:hypothetical protein PANT_13c00080 [Moesziomyces antarcticus T-34]|uniref:Uncharacterized protein n=1 Tax=Pseudozyma antarctica (strain T-34) TaxID=1151754 RepID=M9MG71_PSEA3|nr:hypothetical protein PANT_13c00080 [Moesziomyces antarcticus T-34]
MRARRSQSDAHPIRLGRADLGHTRMPDQDVRWAWGGSTGPGQHGSQQAEAVAAAWHQERTKGLGRLDWYGLLHRSTGSPEDRAPSVHVLILLGPGTERSFVVLHAAAGRQTQLFQHGFALEEALLCGSSGYEQL